MTPSKEDEDEGQDSDHRFVDVLYFHLNAVHVFQLARFDEVVAGTTICAVGISAAEVNAACALYGVSQADMPDVAHQVRVMSNAAAKYLNDKRK